jgi:hypothetical protein
MFLDMIVTPGDLSPEGLAAFHFRGARHLLHRFAFGEQLQHLPLPPTQLPQRNLVHGWAGRFVDHASRDQRRDVGPAPERVAYRRGQLRRRGVLEQVA